MNNTKQFPKDFFFGAASASYQVEGAAFEDGRGLSIWDTFTEQPEKIKYGHTGAIACDHYHRYKQDVALMKQVGLEAYRFSISWTRVLPNGVGAINPKGIAFYDKLVDELLEANITPWATLYHWDFPYALYNRGGWLNRDSSDWFAEYTKVVVEALSDRVQNWFTHNEPQVVAYLGHKIGEHAPGVKLGKRDELNLIHNILLSHGKSVQAIRAYAKATPKVGLAPVNISAMPASESPEDIQAAKDHVFQSKGVHASGTTWWSDPAFFGEYPQEAFKEVEHLMPQIKADDMKTIQQPLDFYGMNLYSGAIISADPQKSFEQYEKQLGEPETHFEWTVRPEVLYWQSKFIYERYQAPIVVTENGLASTDWIALDGGVHDPARIDYTSRYLKAYQRAIEDGVEALGYFHWTIMDNFEWAEGYSKRFGMIHVDFETQKRTLKDSAYWYQNLIKSRQL
jgi:beta-glucosidase